MSIMKLIILSSSETKIANFAFTAHDNEYTFSNSTPVAFRFSQGG